MIRKTPTRIQAEDPARPRKTLKDNLVLHLDLIALNPGRLINVARALLKT
jgi:hypothetical protein